MGSLRKISGCFAVAALAALACAPGALAATIDVTTGADLPRPAQGCTLRDAITAANTNMPKGGCPTGENGADADVIRIGARPVDLSGSTTGEHDNADGDLDITGSLVLEGAGAGSTTIDAHQIDRVIHVLVGGNVTVTGVTITGGRSATGAAGVNGANGGGILNEGDLTIENSRVVDNGTGNGHGAAGAGTDGGSGGGIYNSGSLAIASSVVEGNGTGAGGSGGGDGGNGGGIGGNGVSMTLQTSTVSGNSTGPGGSGGNGGGVDGSGGARTITNSTIALNQAAGSGGGVASADGMLTLLHATLAGNLGAGPDLRVASGDTTVANSIVGGCSGTIGDGGGDVGTDGTCPGAPGDPRLGPLQGNGGPTPTMALGPGSAAIDRIPAADGACLVDTDQRGAARPAGPACDAGAFEAAFAPAAAGGASGPDETAPRADQAAVQPSTFALAPGVTPANGMTAARARGVSRGTTIRYRLSEPAEALLSIERQTAGLSLRRSKRGKVRCAKATRKNRRTLVKQLKRRLGKRAAGRAGRKRLARTLRRARCKLYVPIVVLKRTSGSGINRVPFTGRFRRGALRRGRYRVVIVATDAADNRSKPARASFRVVAAR